jgi:hypothetical protein
MAVAPVVLPTSGHAACGDPATWWLSRYKASTQQTYATYLPRWTAWCAGRRLNPLQAGRADVERWLRTVADSGLSRASTAGHYDAVASIYRQAFDENPIAIKPVCPDRPAEGAPRAAASGGAGVRRLPHRRSCAGTDPSRHERQFLEPGVRAS